LRRLRYFRGKFQDDSRRRVLEKTKEGRKNREIMLTTEKRKKKHRFRRKALRSSRTQESRETWKGEA